MTAQHPLFDAIDEMAESARHLTTDEAEERFNAELDRCIQRLKELKDNPPPRNE
jgi:flagellin-specific chaperone FliS